jgi:hypothetical protein
MALKPEVLVIASSSCCNSNTGLFRQTVAGAVNFPTLFQPAIATVKSWLSILDVTYAGDLLSPGSARKEAITKHPTALQEAFLAGQKSIRE